MSARARPAGQSGFTIIEVMIAALVLAIGMFGTVALVERADQATLLTNQREGATNLAREVLEQARGIPFAQITDAGLPPKLEAPTEPSSVHGSQLRVDRRGLTYRVDLEVCAIDDVRDGYGAHSGGEFCPGPSGTADPEPNDFKQVRADVTWNDARGASHRVRQTALVTTHGTADPPVMTSLVATPPPAVLDPAQPQIGDPAVTAVTFAAETATAAKVIWSLDGLDRGEATLTSGKWVFTVPLTDAGGKVLSDGDYDVGVRAVDDTGRDGPTRVATMRLIRTVPGPVANLRAGRNTVRESGVAKAAVELDWTTSPERNVQGYRVYRNDGSLACPADMTTLSKTASCVDTAPVTGTYKVLAVYRDAAGVLGEGAAATASVPSPTRKLYFTDVASTLGSCAWGLDEAFAGATERNTTMNGDGTLTFCSVQQSSAGRFYSGQGQLAVTATNGSSSSCTINAWFTVNGDYSRTTPTATVTIPPTATRKTFTWPLTIGNWAVGTGEVLAAHFARSADTGCPQTRFYWGSSTERSNAEVTRLGGPPAPPTALTSAPATDGRKLSWTASAGGTVAFYRVYRGGTDHTQRLDRTGLGTNTSYTVRDANGAQQYWVTAVGPNLAESAPVGPVIG
jgi:prepilin-type N-terminal cleavage/methylation domain-containing protein